MKTSFPFLGSPANDGATSRAIRPAMQRSIFIEYKTEAGPPEVTYSFRTVTVPRAVEACITGPPPVIELFIVEERPSIPVVITAEP